MGLVAIIGWVIFGVIYVLYKLGKDESGGSFLIGVLFVLIPSAIFAVAGVTGWIATEVSEFWGPLFLHLSLIALCVLWRIKGRKEDKEQRNNTEQTQKELSECVAIAKRLPLPTRSQMAQFINEIRTIENPSEQQQIYRRFLQEADANKRTYPLDATRFKDMQAAWIFCSKNDSKSSRRKYEFGDQDLSKKAYFDPSIDRSGEPTTGWDEKSFYMLVKQIPLNLKENWCCQPRFARKVFGMMEESETISAESLYPIMLECYQHPASCETETDAALAKVRMRDDLTSVWLSLIPKVIHVLSQVPFSRDEEQEWLKIEDFQVICLPAVSEQRCVTSEELFPEMLELYNDLLNTEFSRQPQKYSFVTLWHGLDSVGKAVGKEGSFFDYPKFIPKEEKEGYYDRS